MVGLTSLVAMTRPLFETRLTAPLPGPTTMAYGPTGTLAGCVGFVVVEADAVAVDDGDTTTNDVDPPHEHDVSTSKASKPRLIS
jgi:hypothetical protein